MPPRPAFPERSAIGFSTVVLDLDGTLIDSAPELTGALNTALAPLGRRPLTPPEVHGMIGNGMETLTRRALLATGPDTGSDARPDNQTLPDGDAFAAIVRAVRTAYKAAPPSTLFPGVADTLARLRAAGAVLVLCTNKPHDAAEDLIARIGLSSLFAAIAGGGRFGALKPDPAPVHGLLDLVGATCADAVFVGDSGTDAQTARAAGLPFVAVSYGYPQGPIAALKADAVIDRFADLPDALERLAATGRPA